VKAFYEAQVPAGRGCRVLDVVRAIYYIMEQEYETGQAIPVTGGKHVKLTEQIIRLRINYEDTCRAVIREERS
jgi:hypothetical protein